MIVKGLQETENSQRVEYYHLYMQKCELSLDSMFDCLVLLFVFLLKLFFLGNHSIGKFISNLNGLCMTVLPHIIQ